MKAITEINNILRLEFSIFYKSLYGEKKYILLVVTKTCFRFIFTPFFVSITSINVAALKFPVTYFPKGEREYFLGGNSGSKADFMKTNGFHFKHQC